MTSFASASYGIGSLGPLDSFAYEDGAATNQGIGSFSALTSWAISVTDNSYSYGTGSFVPLAGMGAEGEFAQAITSFLSLTGEASAGELAPTYAVASNRFNVLLSWSHGYTPAGYFYGCIQDPYGFVASGTPRAPNAFEGTMPAPVLSARAGHWAALEMAMPTLLASGMVPAIGRATLTMPLPEVLGAGIGGGYAVARMQMPAPTVIGYFGAVAQITLQDGYVISFSGTQGAVGSALLTLPLFELVASGTEDAYGRAELEMPMLVVTPSGVAQLVAPYAYLVAVGTATIAVDYEAYAATIPDNLPDAPERPKTYPVTRFADYPFTQIVRHGTEYYGVAPTGLYRLGGDTDNGAAIPWDAHLCKTNFGSFRHKSVGSMYLGGRLNQGVTFSVGVEENRLYSYAYRTPRDATPQNHRQHFGKGIKSTYFSFGWSDPLGRFVEIDNCEFEVAELKRAI